MMRVLGYLVMALGLGSSLTYVFLVETYVRTLPRSPQAETGMVIPLSEHGAIVFLTQSQNAALWYLILAGIVLSAFGAILVHSSRAKR
jgi:hypothetical protein